jgi:hypothetical protein
MPIFKGQLWLVPERAHELSVKIFLDEERIKVTSGHSVIGDWPLADVEMELRNNDIHMFVEGEELVVWSPDPEFAPALVGEEVAESFEAYVPYEPSSGRHLRRRKRKRLVRRILGRS